MKKFAIALLCIFSQIVGKVLIITHSYNRPEFIELHAYTFKAFLQDEYEYVVFNDAADKNMKQQIENTCKNLGVRCFRIPQKLHIGPNSQFPGYRHMVGIKYSLEKLGFDFDGVVAFVDSDMFLLKPLSIEKYLENYDIAGELQGRADATHQIRYLSPALVFMNMQTLPNKRTLNFDGGNVDNLICDVGGNTYHYFKNNSSVRASHINVVHIGNWSHNVKCTLCNNVSCNNCIRGLTALNFTPNLIKFVQECPNQNIEFFLDKTFLHYRGGSNWDGQVQEYHSKKTQALYNLMQRLLENK